MTAVIFAAGEYYPCDELYIPDGAFVIAADAGLNKLNELGITPDLIIGDFDSLGYTPKGNVKVYPSRKDDTDTALAVKTAIEYGFDSIIIYGGLGGERFDHAVSNIEVTEYAASKGARAYLVSNGQTVTAIRNGKAEFSSGKSGYISVMALAGTARGVSIKGLSYTADGITLEPTDTLGTSNMFTGNEAEISVEDGILTLIYRGGGRDIA
ncbi:MAG: thiamine diphosphokinase [Clostridia bacterium]|nr:thiamine diphosphokinase [Clostridia bacterium]